MSWVHSPSAHTQPVAETSVVSGHTPGPWHLVRDDRSNGNGRNGFPNSDSGAIFLICGRAGAPVVSRRGIAKPSKPEGRANATLMTASPDLLSAAIFALRFAEAMDADFGVGGDEAQTLRAAIAKATGEA